MRLAHDQKESLDQRRCFVCQGVIPSAEGCYHGHLSILTHRGACVTAVEAHERIHDRSTRGRWRPVKDVLQRLREARTQQ